MNPSLLASILRIPAAGEKAPDPHRDMRKEIHKYVSLRGYMRCFDDESKPLHSILWRDVIFPGKTWWKHNGEPHKDCAYKNGKFHGEYTEYWGDGKTPYEHCFYNERGDLHGEYKNCYEDGTPIVRCSYENGKLHGPYKDYFKGTSLVETHCFYEHGKLEGVYKKYTLYKTNILASVLIMNGRVTRALRQKCFYENDERHGPYKEYDKDKQKLEKHYFYENGKLHGLYKRRQSGNHTYVKGELFEEFKKRNRDGTFKKHFTYDVGKKQTNNSSAPHYNAT